MTDTVKILGSICVAWAISMAVGICIKLGLFGERKQ